MVSREPITKIKKKNTANFCRNKIKFLFFSSFAIFICSVVLQLFVTNEIAVKGKEIVILEQNKASLEKEISELKLEQSKYSSLSYIEEEASKLGFVKNNKYTLTVAPITSTASLTSY